MDYRRCQQCGMPNKGWRPVPRWGKLVCPACAAGVKREPALDALAKRRLMRDKVIAQIQAEDAGSVAREKMELFLHELENGIEILEMRKKEENTEKSEIK